jgi:hypothetical protein
LDFVTDEVSQANNRAFLQLAFLDEMVFLGSEHALLLVGPIGEHNPKPFGATGLLGFGDDLHNFDHLQHWLQPFILRLQLASAHLHYRTFSQIYRHFLRLENRLEFIVSERKID